MCVPTYRLASEWLPYIPLRVCVCAVTVLSWMYRLPSASQLLSLNTAISPHCSSHFETNEPTPYLVPHSHCPACDISAFLKSNILNLATKHSIDIYRYRIHSIVGRSPSNCVVLLLCNYFSSFWFLFSSMWAFWLFRVRSRSVMVFFKCSILLWNG